MFAHPRGNAIQKVVPQKFAAGIRNIQQEYCVTRFAGPEPSRDGTGAHVAPFHPCMSDSCMSDRSLETELQRRLDDWCAAIRARDVDAVMAHYAADVIAFDLLPPMQYRGA